MSKSSASTATLHFTDWIKRQCLMGKTNPGEGPTCDFHHKLFTPDVISAILAGAFDYEPAILEIPQLSPRTLTPWHFLASIPDLSMTTPPRLPKDGLSAQSLPNWTRNIAFLFHILYWDFNYFGTLGHNHSMFSHFSLLGGSLRFVELILMDVTYHRDWAQQPPAHRERRSLVFGYLLADLFQIFATWANPTMPNSQFFLQCSIDTVMNLPLINPC